MRIVAPWQALVVERGVTLKVAQMDPERGQLEWNDFEGLINKKTKSCRSARDVTLWAR